MQTEILTAKNGLCASPLLLKLKELPIGEIDARIAEVTQVLNIGHLLDKMTEDLDEKERALVVLGRAIVKKPKVFLLDEPFSSLSKELKKEMQELLWSLYEKMQITVVYVTHNSEDIRHTDTRVAVMNDGSVQQIGTIGELYDKPATPYVSEFLGVPAEVPEGGHQSLPRPHYCCLQGISQNLPAGRG